MLRSNEPTVLLIGGDATRGAGLTAAARIAAATGTRWYCETFPTRLERGAGIPAVDRIPYFAEAVVAQLDGAKHLMLAGAASPVSFFAYPGQAERSGAGGLQRPCARRPTRRRRGVGGLADDLAPGTTAAVADAVASPTCPPAR